MQVKDLIIKRTAEELGQDENIVSLVISDAYEKLSKASRKHDQLEISGFGVLILSPSKLRKRITKYEKIIEHLNKMEQNELTMKKIETTTATLNYFKERLIAYE
jgi:hypothetical protein